MTARGLLAGPGLPGLLPDIRRQQAAAVLACSLFSFPLESFA